MTTKNLPQISIISVYSPKYDLWVTDLRLNKVAEDILASFKLNTKKEYSVLYGEKKNRYMFKGSFASGFERRLASERILLCSLFDVTMFGSGKRTMFAENYSQVQAQLIFLKEIMKRLTGEKILLSRKLVGNIGGETP